MYTPATVEPTRRDFLGKACAATACATCAFAAVPAASYLVPRASRKPSGPLVVARNDEIPEGGAKLVTVEEAKFMLVRLGGQYFAMSAVCTHLSCTVDWDAKDKLVRCYCHGGAFTPEGKRRSGPPPRDLEPVPVKVLGNRVIMTF